MQLKDFDYPVPKELIAQYPLKKRDNCRLLVMERSSGKIYHDKFCRILNYLPRHSTLILNDSKVIPARIWGKRETTGGKVEVLLLKMVDSNNTFKALINPLGKLKVDERLIFNGSKISCRLIDPKNRLVRFNRDILKTLNQIGHVPLPPYIKRPDEKLDRDYYQTVYARKNGSVASPTAGLHFTPQLLSQIKRGDIKIAKITLHVNYATFKPVSEEDITRHKMYCEDYAVSAATLKTIRQTRNSGGKIIAVGTTSCRVLETVADQIKEDSRLKNLKGSTEIYIYPGYEFKSVDALITNFHFPRTTLFLLVCAFAGRNLIMRAYQEAIARKYLCTVLTPYFTILFSSLVYNMDTLGYVNH